MLRTTHLIGFGAGGQRVVTWNPADKGSGVTLSNENMTASMAATFPLVRATRSFSDGKRSWENRVDSVSGFSPIIGVAKSGASLSSYLGADANGWGYYGDSGNKISNGSSVPYGATFGAGDIITVRIDLTTGDLEFLKNNASQGVAYTGLSGTFFPAISSSAGGTEVITGRFRIIEFTYAILAGYTAIDP